MAKLETVQYISFAVWTDDYDEEYNKEAIQLKARLEDGDNWEEVLNDLKEKVRTHLQDIDRYREIERTISDREYKLRKLEEKIAIAQRNWEMINEFLVTQGITSDPAKFPDLIKTLPNR